MENPDSGSPQPEFTHVLDISSVSKSGTRVKLVGDDNVRQRLANRYKINAIKSLSAFLEIKPWRKDGVHVVGSLNAEVEQACIVSLEPVEAQISEDVSVFCIPQPNKDEAENEIMLDPQSDDDFEVFEDNEIDLGEMIAEQLAVALDPYPRKADAELSTVLPSGTEVPDKKVQSPFKVLKAMNIADKKNDTD
jgi:uncharacterized metal-binding protein YceD (DUF177 family)